MASEEGINRTIKWIILIVIAIVFLGFIGYAFGGKIMDFVKNLPNFG